MNLSGFPTTKANRHKLKNLNELTKLSLSFLFLCKCINNYFLLKIKKFVQLKISKHFLQDANISLYQKSQQLDLNQDLQYRE